MATDLFCVTYAPDAVWLDYMLRSIDKYARKFRQTVVVFPQPDAGVLGPVCAKHPNVVTRTFTPTEKGHIDQNVQKTRADLYSDADFFLHIDSDCVFTEEVTPLDYSTDGKPDLWFDEYENLLNAHPGGVPWQAITEHALGFPCPVETMRRFPILYPRWLYRATRDRIEERHGMPLEVYALQAPLLGRAFHGYSEFNALGSVAYVTYPGQFCLRHMRTYDEKPPKLKAFWSHWIRQDVEKFRNEVLPELERITANHDAHLAAA